MKLKSLRHLADQDSTKPHTSHLASYLCSRTGLRLRYSNTYFNPYSQFSFQDGFVPQEGGRIAQKKRDDRDGYSRHSSMPAMTIWKLTHDVAAAECRSLIANKVLVEVHL